MPPATISRVVGVERNLPSPIGIRSKGKKKEKNDCLPGQKKKPLFGGEGVSHRKKKEGGRNGNVICTILLI